MRRTLVFLLSLLVAASLAFAAPAQAATPKVTKLSATAGPLAPTALTLTGKTLKAVTKVRFGTKQVSVTSRSGSTSITVKTPRQTKPTSVAVAIRSGSKWIGAGRYAFLAKPKLSSLSTTSGYALGGKSVTLRGTALTPKPVVMFGNQKAVVVRSSATSVVATSPAGSLGATSVVVRTAGGASSGKTFTYLAAPAASKATYTPVSTTFTGNPVDVQWVSGGTDPDNVATTAGNPWTVSLRPGAPLPTVGKGYFLRPGAAVFPSGLAGTVDSVATQQDGSFRIVVVPSSIADTLGTSTISFSGDSTPTVAARAAAGTSDADFASKATYSDLGPGAFTCKNKINKEIDFKGSLSLKFTKLHPEFSFSGGFSPELTALISGTVVVSGKATASEAATCSLKPAWVDAHRKVIPIGTTGATISFAPAAQVKLSLAGTAEFSQSTKFTYGIKKVDGRDLQFLKDADSSAPKFALNASITLTASAGVSIQVGLLDRIGAELTGELYADASLTAPIATNDPNPESCVKAELGFKVGISAFLDLFVKRWETPTKSFKIPFTQYMDCTPVPTAAASSGNPVVTTSALPNARVDEEYTQQLEIQGGRDGTWSLAGSALPPGLMLEANGVIAGTPLTTGIGGWHPTIKFIDVFGRSAQALLSLQVLPTAGLGGGDVQATLTWNGEADLDLHAIEPNGDEIYYGSPGPTASSGRWDYDSNAACGSVDPTPAENVFWPVRAAPTGRYEFWVDTYDSCDATDLNWHLVVRSKGKVVLDQMGSGSSIHFGVGFGG
ncbi:MAG: hypothetical protein JWQ74_1237 [Marmoricola sp.]|nr:hypothetical protein [Marmoricola sp.]